MDNQDNKNTKIIQHDIFNTHILKSNIQNQEQRFINAIRFSMMARGDQNKIEYFKQLNFKARPQKKQILSYEQQTIKKYGLQGILLKQSPNFFGGWEQRYCILKGNHMQQVQMLVLQILIFYRALLRVLCQVNSTLLRIKVHNSEKYFVFRAENNEQTTQWIQKLQIAHTTSQGYKNNFIYLTHYPRFWRKDYVSLAQFEKTAQTADVILFRGSKNTSVMQRAITGDQFDHVAAVIMNCKNQPLIFQANGGFGVGICPWSQFITKKWYANYDLIVHRHLNVSRNEEFSQIVDRFVSANMGKEYDFSLKQYLFSRNSSSQGDKQVYFCSSLVAKLYKNLELLKPDKSSTQYLPSWFSNKGGQLRKDGKFGLASFDDEKIIVFQKVC